MEWLMKFRKIVGVDDIFQNIRTSFIDLPPQYLIFLTNALLGSYPLHFSQLNEECEE